ncbi:putative monovalent cation/H+ antiporter subunit A [Fulvivirga kasyanovii]|uniref:DUF4040 domain-containing protein n=1 Tax=Fulvivirga kasyanovii TaxID=396812 RepID=A0ABW9RNC8_9BACT|nr:hydrogen gas-evolving membrane-bound hydrogenase subunit E [Fulvivirga kasyanovii]MTI25629.1 DUF4040 domain-containing protein [Fulvivirga kasyanovii]
MLLSVLSIFLGAILASFVAKKFNKSAGILLAIIPLGSLGYFLSLYEKVRHGEVLAITYSWVDTLNIHLSFYLDGLSMLFVLLILGIGVLILVYSNGYMLHHEGKGKFYSYMLLFMGAMLGLVLAGNLITLYVFWELTGITSFLLIGFKHTEKSARAAALQALLVTELGGLALLTGFIIIGNISNSYEISELLNQHEVLTGHPLYTPMLLLILLGAFTKSAQFPFHFWLPSAMKAPTPVSAYLHSAAMVNAGIYLLARLNPMLGNTDMWQNYVTLFGGITMLAGAYLSLTQKDLKAILAYVTISALGILMMLIGIGTFLSVKAALLYLVVHALYKATLFMTAGTIDETTGTRNIDELGGLWKAMPVTMVASILALLSMAGLPPMLGYISKEFIYEAGKQAPGVSDYVLVCSVLANAFMVAISIIYGYKIFFRKKHLNKPITEAGATFWAGPALLAVFSLILALFPKPLEPLLESALGAVKVVPIKVELKFWHGFNVVFLLSLITVTVGVLLFWGRKQVIPFLEKINARLFKIELAHVFNKTITQLVSLAKKNTSFFQHGYYRIYIMVIFIVASGLVWYQLYRTWTWQFTEGLSPVSYYATAIVVAICVAAVAVAISRSRLVAIITIGVAGFGIALLYMIYGAVDLAITQVFVEVLTLVLFIMIFHKLPAFSKHLSRTSKTRDAVIALTVGVLMAALVIKADHLNLSYPVSNYIAQNSYEEGHGRNIVNVILVDFRAFDTLGEVIVITMASLGIFSLLKIKKSKTTN